MFFMQIFLVAMSSQAAINKNTNETAHDHIPVGVMRIQRASNVQFITLENHPSVSSISEGQALIQESEFASAAYVQEQNRELTHWSLTPFQY